ncbi:cysteine desulfurase NifS, partial [bacterium]
MSRIYLDGTLTTRTDPQVLEEMLPYFAEKYAVSSSQFSHSQGKAIEEEIEKR